MVLLLLAISMALQITGWALVVKHKIMTATNLKIQIVALICSLTSLALVLM